MSCDQIHDDLFNKILVLELKPGQLVSENAVAAQYGVSRTPIRAIFQRLANENLLEIRPQKGTYVTLLDFEYIRETVYIRTLAENDILHQAAESADEKLLTALSDCLAKQLEIVRRGPDADPAEFYRLDTAFHRLCFMHVGREKLWDILQASQVHYQRFRMLDIVSSSILETLWEQHNRLFQHFKAKDLDALGKVLDEHLHDGIRRIEERVMNEHPDFFHPIS